ncbi:MAG: sigma 54-interacting transcriptional regulator [Acidobacteria bacterium]|nr:sigma 54-interacting transcriptional regulator [Acidobacteriota bacterium]
MVTTALQRTLADVLNAVTGGIAQCPSVALTRIWLLLDDGDCRVCAARGNPPATARSLHLVASAGTARNSDQDCSHLQGAFHRFALGERKIGRVAHSSDPLLLAGLRGDEDWIANPAWMAAEGIRTFAAQPLVFRGEVLGVLALFDRGVLNAAAFEWMRVFADYAAVSIANARAFEEIEHLRSRLEEENLYLREEVSEALGGGDFVGESEALQKVLRQVQLVAPTDAAVLITGESGTGKELVARAIHNRSVRSARALIKVNCAAVPESLFESEFFGHVRGAFTGAMTDRTGRFELADGGTLFLDEIGELPLAMQTKLLRVLQEKEFERVGDTRTRKVDVRVIAATNRDLKQEVEAGRFRRDLFYRLSVFPIDIPPIRERRDDIPLLVRHFVHQTCRKLNRAAPRVSQTALDKLVRHAWPGNIRELQNVVERAIILWQGGPFTLPLDAGQPNPVPAGTQSAPPEPQLLTREELKQLERESLVEALRRAQGRVFGARGAAELLGMRPTTLASRLRALRIKQPNSPF